MPTFPLPRSSVVLNKQKSTNHAQTPTNLPTRLHAELPTPRLQDGESQKHLAARDQDAQQDQHDDDPGQAIHLVVGDVLGQDLGQVEEDAAPLVEDLDARLDLEVFAHGAVQRVQRWFGFPDQGRDVEDVGGWEPGGRQG